MTTARRSLARTARWESPYPPHSVPTTTGLVAALVALALVTGAATYLVARSVLVTGLWLALLAVALWRGAVAGGGREVLRRVGARELAPHESPRLANLAAGLARDLRTETPGLWIVPDGGANALMCFDHGPTIAVTHTLLESYSRTELEAVVAHCLVRLVTPGARSIGFVSQLGALGRRALPRVGGEDDLRAAALTRYPPALASAIEKAEPRRDPMPVLWFVSDDPTHLPQKARIEELRDL